MTGSIEITSRIADRDPKNKNGLERGRWGRLMETLTRLSVIGILGLAGQQSISGYQAVYARGGDILGQGTVLVDTSAPVDLVFSPNGAPGAATVITIADASGHTSTIMVDAAGDVIIN